MLIIESKNLKSLFVVNVLEIICVNHYFILKSSLSMLSVVVTFDLYSHRKLCGEGGECCIC